MKVAAVREIATRKSGVLTRGDRRFLAFGPKLATQALLGAWSLAPRLERWMQVRKKKRGYYLRRFLPYPWWKRAAYGSVLLIAIWFAAIGRLPLAVVLFIADFATRAIDVVIGDQLRKRRSAGFHNYYTE